MSAIQLPPESLEVAEDVDVVVIGGGSAGTAAAITSARLGLRTLLAEEMPFLGGMSTGGCVGTYCGFYLQQPDGELTPLVGGLPLEIANQLLRRRHAYGPVPFKQSAALPYVPWGLKLLLEELACAEPRLRVLLHAKLTHALVEGTEIRGVALQTRGGRIAARARVYIDATGDAELSRMAGVPTTVGQEIQYPSMMFTMQHVDLKSALGSLAKLPDLLAEHFERDRLPRKSGNLIPTGRPGEVLVALSRLSLRDRPVNATEPDELTWGEMEGRAQVARLAEFLRSHVPGFANAFLGDSAARLGVRETRKIRGEYVLTEYDVLGLRQFEDGIGRSAWPIERHVRGGETQWTFLEPGTWYTIPYRSLLPLGPANLLVAGRCLSAEPAAFASVRVIGPCMLEGQAAAAAARRICEQDCAARDVDVERIRKDLAGLGVPL